MLCEKSYYFPLTLSVRRRISSCLFEVGFGGGRDLAGGKICVELELSIRKQAAQLESMWTCKKSSAVCQIFFPYCSNEA